MCVADTGRTCKCHPAARPFPAIGIGAACSGEVLVAYDLLGITRIPTPPTSKETVNAPLRRRIARTADCSGLPYAGLPWAAGPRSDSTTPRIGSAGDRHCVHQGAIAAASLIAVAKASRRKATSLHCGFLLRDVLPSPAAARAAAPGVPHRRSCPAVALIAAALALPAPFPMHRQPDATSASAAPARTI